MSDFTHFNEQGRAKMVDVGEKPISQRIAVAAGRVLVNAHTFVLIQSGGMKKEMCSPSLRLRGSWGQNAPRTSSPCVTPS